VKVLITTGSSFLDFFGKTAFNENVMWRSCMSACFLSDIAKPIFMKFMLEVCTGSCGRTLILIHMASV
jgi:hypothetical protein